MAVRICFPLFSILLSILFLLSFSAYGSDDRQTFGLVPPVTKGPIKGLPDGLLGPIPKFEPVQPTQKEYDCFVLINEARANPGAYGYGSYAPAPPLHWNAALLYIGWVHSKDMYEENYFEHDSFNRVGGQLVFDRLWSERVRSVYTYNTRISENIAWNTSGSAQEIVTTWMNSPPHRENIMNPELTEGAIGAFGGSDKVYFTHDFGGRAISYNLSLNASDVSLNPPQAQPGETVRLSFLVRNTGVTDTFPVEVQIHRRAPGGSWTEVTDVLRLQSILEGGKNASTYIDLDTTGYAKGTEVLVNLDPQDGFSETSESDNSVQTILLPTGSSSPGDLNSDGTLNGKDVFRFCAGWQRNDSTCNLDTQSYVDSRDLMLLIKMLQ